MVYRGDLSRQEHFRQRGQQEILHPLTLVRCPEGIVILQERCLPRVARPLMHPEPTRQAQREPAWNPLPGLLTLNLAHRKCLEPQLRRVHYLFWCLLRRVQ